LSHLDLSAGARRSTSISRFAQVFFTQSLLGPVAYRTAASGAKPPFLGISAYGGKANLPIIRLDL
jgi:hypothetical protein